MRLLRPILQAIFPCFALLGQGCTVIGGMVGSLRPEGPTRTRIVSAAEIRSLTPGTRVYATIPDRETLTGAFRGVSDSAGRSRLRMESIGAVVSIPLDSINELVEDIPARNHLVQGALLGAAIDVMLVGGTYWIYSENRKHIVY